MSRQLIAVIEQLCREKGIDAGVVVNALESALLVAAKKKFGSACENINVSIDPKTGEVQVIAIKKIVENVQNPREEISLEEASKMDENAEIGNEIGNIIPMEDIGRIAAETVKQVIIQKVREAEWDVILKDFKDKQGELINGVVMRQERRDYIVDIGKTEGILPAKEQIPGEAYRRGDRIKAYILNVRPKGPGPQIMLSRTHPNFLVKLFEKEVPEICKGIVTIKDVVRGPDGRTKIAVASKDSSVDPVGICVGVNGSRVKAVVKELRGEKIDIVAWGGQKVFVFELAKHIGMTNKKLLSELKAMGIDAKSYMSVLDDKTVSLVINKFAKGKKIKAEEMPHEKKKGTVLIKKRHKEPEAPPESALPKETPLLPQPIAEAKEVNEHKEVGTTKPEDVTTLITVQKIIPAQQWEDFDRLIFSIRNSKPRSRTQNNKIKFLESIKFIETVESECDSKSINIEVKKKEIMSLTQCGNEYYSEKCIRNNKIAANKILGEALKLHPAVILIFQTLRGCKDIKRINIYNLLKHHNFHLEFKKKEEGLDNFLDILKLGGIISYNKNTKNVKILWQQDQDMKELPHHQFISPETPYSNIKRLKDIIKSLKGTAYWIDKHFDKKAFDMLVDSLDAANITNFIIFSGNSNITQSAIDEFLRLKKELHNKGINIELKIITDLNLLSSFHDRWLHDSNITWNIPPVNSIFKGQESEMSKTSNTSEVKELVIRCEQCASNIVGAICLITPP